MPRVKKSVTAKAKHKKVLSSTKGHYGARSRLFKTAKQSNIKSLQYAYEKCGWKVTFHTTTAVAHSEGAVTFFTDENEKYFEWGGSIIESRVAKKPVGVTR